MHPVLLAIMASCFWGVGTALQKRSVAAQFPKISLGQFLQQIGPIVKALGTNWIWVAGLVLMLGGGGAFATALGRGDITVVQPIVSLTGVVAALIGVVFLKEKVTRIEWTGIGIILLGVVLVGVSSGEPLAQMPADREIMVLTALACALTAFSFVIRKMGVTAEFSLSFAAGILYGLSNPAAKLMTQRASLAAGGAAFSLANGAMWANAFSDYPIVIIILANVFGMIFFQTALANGRASVVSPIVTIVSTVLPILAAVTVFGEKVNPLQAAGMAVVVIGTAMLAKKEEKPKTIAAETSAKAE